jgi:hypothetical protein
MSLPTAAAQWAFLRQRYQPGDALYLSVVRQEHALQQGDSTTDEFYTQSNSLPRFSFKVYFLIFTHTINGDFCT